MSQIYLELKQSEFEFSSFYCVYFSFQILMNAHCLTHVTALMACVLIQWDPIHVPVVITLSLDLTTSVMVGVQFYGLYSSI